MPVNLTENKALVRRYYDEVLTARNRSVLGQLLHSSFVGHVRRFRRWSRSVCRRG
jgi:hypothetical protein